MKIVANHIKFYYAIKMVHPDIQIISNCDRSSKSLDHPTNLYDYHIYTSASNIISMAHTFDITARSGRKAFVSEYAVTGNDAGHGSLLTTIGEVGFLIGLETNNDVVKMASYMPLFVNTNNHRWNLDAIVFDSWKKYETLSQWVQQLFRESSGVVLLHVITQENATSTLIASTIRWNSLENGEDYIGVKAVNFGSSLVT